MIHTPKERSDLVLHFLFLTKFSQNKLNVLFSVMMLQLTKEIQLMLTKMKQIKMFLLHPSRKQRSQQLRIKTVHKKRQPKRVIQMEAIKILFKMNHNKMKT